MTHVLLIIPGEASLHAGIIIDTAYLGTSYDSNGRFGAEGLVLNSSDDN